MRRPFFVYLFYVLVELDDIWLKSRYISNIGADYLRVVPMLIRGYTIFSDRKMDIKLYLYLVGKESIVFFFLQ